MIGKAYTVRYGIYNADPKRIRWGVLVGITGDDILPTGTHRTFDTAQGERYEIPIANMVFVFSRERLDGIIAQREAAQAQKEPLSDA